MARTCGGKGRSTKIYTYILFLLYLILLIWVIIFKTRIALPLVRESRDVNLIPFLYTDPQNGDIPLLEALANVLVFIPFGLYLKMLGFNVKRIILCGFLSSLFFETVQLIFAIGVFDVTDLITNTSGCALGMLGYMLMLRIFKSEGKLQGILKIVATVFTALALALFLTLLVFEILYFL